MTVALVPVSHAFEVRRDEDRVTIAADEVIDDTLIVSAQDVVIEGTVTGDLIAMGDRITVRGPVGGTMLAVAEVVSVENAISGSFIGGGETIDIRGTPVGANVYAVGSRVTLHGGASVAGNVAVAASETEIRGAVGRGT